MQVLESFLLGLESEGWEGDATTGTVLPSKNQRTKTVRHLDIAAFVKVLRHNKARDSPCLRALAYWSTAALKKKQPKNSTIEAKSSSIL